METTLETDFCFVEHEFNRLLPVVRAVLQLVAAHGKTFPEGGE